MQDIIVYAKKYQNGHIEYISNTISFAFYKNISEFRARTQEELFTISMYGSEALELLKQFMLNEENQVVEKYSAKYQNLLKAQKLTYYDMSVCLSIFYKYDYYHNISRLEDSCLYSALHFLNHDDFQHVLTLYQFYIKSLSEPLQVFEVLKEMLEEP